MQKQKEYKVEDSNIANLGSDLDKKIRQAAAQTEQAWTGAGKKIGMEIWRIEKFKVVPVPKDTYGQFYSGDSYICLWTYKKKPDSPALAWNVHFWLGKFTTQDEAGTAAYKTVELDDLLGGGPVQFREVQGHESDLFLTYFNNQIRILDGGVDSGFKHVEPEKYTPRLIHLKGKKRVRATQVDLSYKSMNGGDVFILDAGLEIFQWNGKKAGPQEKAKGAQFVRALNDERKGKPNCHVIEEGEKSADLTAFWKALGGEGPVKSAEEGGSDEEHEKEGAAIRKLFRLSDASGKMEFKEVSSGNDIKRNQLDSNDVFIFDSGSEVYAWIGKKASKDEKKNALGFAQDYLTKFKRPAWLPIVRVLEGGENETFEQHFAYFK
jgi:gelsolin